MNNCVDRIRSVPVTLVDIITVSIITTVPTIQSFADYPPSVRPSNTTTNHSHAKPRSIRNVHNMSFWFSSRGVKNAHLP